MVPTPKIPTNWQWAKANREISSIEKSVFRKTKIPPHVKEMQVSQLRARDSMRCCVGPTIRR